VTGEASCGYTSGMPLQNRVDPFGALVADPARGTLFGNRGGRFHRDDRTLGSRRWASRQWICCVLEFKNRHRAVWARGYTELFFLDEVTALSAGHRPCFECRRREAKEFATCWARAFGLASSPRAGEMDRVLHAERLDGRAKRTHRRSGDDLPDGAMLVLEDGMWALRDGAVVRWTPAGYSARKPRPRDTVEVLTPPATLAVLIAGYRPQWHPSA
jgi:hypothetical protein